MGLALLPPKVIVTEWEEIKNRRIKGLTAVEEVGLRSLQKFVGSYWMVVVGPHIFSVWRVFDR